MKSRMTMRYQEKKMDFKLLEKIQKDLDKIERSKVVKAEDGVTYRVPYTENDAGILLGYQAQILALQTDLLSEILVELTKLNKNNE